MRISIPLLLCCIASLLFVVATATIVNTNVQRHIDLKTQYAAHTLKVEFVNKGEESVSVYQVAVAPNLKDHMAYIAAQTSAETPEKLEVSLIPTVDEKGHLIYDIKLDSPVAAEASKTLEILFIYVHTQKPFPEQIKQSDHQALQYTDSHVWLSPYKTLTIATNLTAPEGSRFIIQSEKKPFVVEGNSIVYGPYTNIEPFTWDEMYAHYGSNTQLLTITRCERDIEVSHWGNVAVEERYWARDDGAKLKGPFSRFEFQRNPQSTPTAIHYFTLFLPAGASDIYYRDEVGNISTSEVVPTDQGLELRIAPRYPLFGGWSTSFYIGYNLPLGNVVRKSTSTRGLYRVATDLAPSFEFSVIDHLVTSVILPEGASGFKVSTPLMVTSSPSISSRRSYLDTVGRPVITVEAHNVVYRPTPIFVDYKFSKIAMLQEPLLLMAGFFALFVIFMGLSRLNLRVSNVRLTDKETIISECLREFNILNDKCEELNSAIFAALDNLRSKEQIKDWKVTKAEYTEAITRVHAQLEDVSKTVNEQDIKLGGKLREITKKQIDRYRLSEQILAQEVAQPGKTKSDKKQQLADLEEDLNRFLSSLFS